MGSGWKGRDAGGTRQEWRSPWPGTQTLGLTDLHLPSLASGKRISSQDRESDGGPGLSLHSFIHSTDVGWTELLMAQHWDSHVIA